MEPTDPRQAAWANQNRNRPEPIPSIQKLEPMSKMKCQTTSIQLEALELQVQPQNKLACFK